MSGLRRALAVTALVALALALLLAPARAVRREVLVDRALNALGDALDRRVARTGAVPAEPLLSGGELARLLREDGDLPEVPRNPDTGRPFGAVDLETDMVFFEATRGGYRIEVLSADGREVVAVRVGPPR